MTNPNDSANLGVETAKEVLADMKPVGLRYVIAEATFQVALPVPIYDDPNLARYATNEAIEYWANDEMDVIEEFLPALEGQMKKDLENLNRYHCQMKVLRDATDEDMKEFSVVALNGEEKS